MEDLQKINETGSQDDLLERVAELKNSVARIEKLKGNIERIEKRFSELALREFNTIRAVNEELRSNLRVLNEVYSSCDWEESSEVGIAVRKCAEQLKAVSEYYTDSFVK